MTDTQTMRDLAAAKLSEQASRFMRAAQSLTRTALRLATIDQPSKVLQALAIYQQSNLPEPEVAAEVSAMIEGTQSPEWRDARTKRHKANDRYRLERDLSGAEQPVELPDWGREMVLRVAREKSELLAAAVLALDNDRDPEGEILHHLTNYMAGRYGVFGVRHALEKAGLAPGQTNVIPLSVRRGRS